MAGNILELNSANFQSTVEGGTPVLVDFWAPWCGPCKLLTPTIEELARDYAGKAKVVKVNVDDNQDLATKYGIRGIPTLMLFKSGQLQERMTGCGQRQENTKRDGRPVQNFHWDLLNIIGGYDRIS